jgi:Concanavalin A-like lectin/glucanases superfamily
MPASSRSELDAPIFQANSNVARNYDNSGARSLDTGYTANWTAPQSVVTAMNGAGRAISLDGQNPSGDSAVLASPSAATLGSYNGGSTFGGFLKTVITYPRLFSAAELNYAINPVRWAGSSALFFPPATSQPYVSAGSHAALQWDRTQAWSAIAAVNVPPGLIDAAAVIFTTSNANDTIYQGYELFINGSGFPEVRLINAFGSNYIDVTSSINVQNGVWHTVGVSYDGSSTAAGVKCYVDGVLDASPTIGSNTLSATIVNAQPLLVGNQTGFQYSGMSIDEFSLSNVARAASYFANYRTASASVDANTVLAYGFNEGTGTTTADLSASGFTGTLSSAPAPAWLH